MNGKNIYSNFRLIYIFLAGILNLFLNINSVPLYSNAQQWEITGRVFLNLNDLEITWYTLAGIVGNEYRNTASWQHYTDEYTGREYRLINLYTFPDKEYEFYAPFFEMIFLIDESETDNSIPVTLLEINFSPSGDLHEFYVEERGTSEITVSELRFSDEAVFSLAGSVNAVLIHDDTFQSGDQFEKYYDVTGKFEVYKTEYGKTYN